MRRTALALALLAAAPTGAEEGMWMPSQIPSLAPRLRALGFRGDPAAFADLAGDPMGAIVSLGGCSASFVSPEGLVATNHHCVTSALQQNSTPERNLLQEGFLARTRADELWSGPLSRVYVTVSVQDVTGHVAGKLSRRLSDLARQEAIERRQKERLADCEKGGLRCTVAPFFDGLLWLEIAQVEIGDVRLVYAPPAGVGRFGGETDNWMWPRHAGDFALLRAWVRPDGKPGPRAPDNVPYRPARWLRVSPEGASPGDLVLVAGYPGKTRRLLTHAEVKAELEWAYPRTLRRYRDQLALLERIAREDPERAIRVSTRIRGLANTMKNREGVLTGGARTGYLERKRSEERALAAWIEADPARRAAYGGALAGLEALQAEQDRTRERDAAFQALHPPQSLLAAARTILRRAGEREKRDLDRDLEYQAREWTRIREGQERLQRSVDLVADRALLRYAVLEAAALPADQRLEPLDRLAGLAPGMAGEEAARKVDAWLDRVYAGTRLADRAYRLSLIEKRPGELAREEDSLLGVARALLPLDATIRAEKKARDGRRSRFAPAYARALVEKAGGAVAPDANSTLRVTFGTVKGVSPRDGLAYAPQTRLAGILEKHRPGDPQFEAPAEVLAAIRAEQARGPGRWRDPALGDVPVNFLATLDITGGNSGSAVLDARGRLCGLAFDGLYESVVADFAHVEEARTIAVDSRYLLWTLAEVARAPHLLSEMGIEAARAER
ncbi:MAG TPA: S46 family peptidase [Anaeromyxobacteraceae bacterium]|nr:S46 family peptidase [Anaeromyxobacteraceae bacterium]